MAEPRKKRAKYGTLNAKQSSYVLPNRIREVRESKLMTGKELSELMGVNASTITYWEQHRMSVADQNKIKLCRILKVSITDLFDWSDK